MQESLRAEIERTFALKIVGEQGYSWGELYWLQLDPNEKILGRTVCVVNIYPGTEQKTHSHPGFEEILIGLTGESLHWSNGQFIVLTPGKVGYIPIHGEHRIVNRTEAMAQVLSIVIPAMPAGMSKPAEVDDDALEQTLHNTPLAEICQNFAESVRLAVTLCDREGNQLIESVRLPAFCVLCAKRQANECLRRVADGSEQEQRFALIQCSFGVFSVQAPIRINDRVWGYLGCGYGRIAPLTEDEQARMRQCFGPDDSAQAEAAYDSMELISRNHLQSVAETLSLVSAALARIITQSVWESQLTSYRLRLANEKRRQAELENALSKARLKVLESQVNPHFLFNTLNTIAQLSLMEGAETAASLTYALSDILHRSLGETDSVVTINDELNHIKDYLHIQQTRFPDKFTVDVQMTPGVETVKIPAMMLIILVENAILHGFRNIRWPGKLVINCGIDGERAYVEVTDNGTGMPETVLRAINEQQRTDEGTAMYRGIGLNNIYRRLRHYYGDQASFTIAQQPRGGIKVRIELPRRQ